MKCPKCSLVTFDYLSKCPRCDASFELSRRLTRRRADPKRRILIASPSSTVGPAAAVSAVEASASLPPLAAVPEPDSAQPPEIAPITAPSEEPMAEPQEVPAATPERVPPVGVERPERAPGQSPEGAPSLREMAETEQREDVTVNVAAAVAAAREAVRAPEDRPAAAVAAPDLLAASAAPDPAPPAADTAESESRRIKERMMRASRARRKERPDRVTESTDPVLPDWYEPDLDESDGAAGPGGDSVDRR